MVRLGGGVLPRQIAVPRDHGGAGENRLPRRHVHHPAAGIRHPRVSRQQHPAGAGGEGDHIPLLETQIGESGSIGSRPDCSAAAAVAAAAGLGQIGAVGLVQGGEGGLVNLLRPLLHTLGDLLFHVGHIGIGDVAFGNQRLPGQCAGGVSRRAAHQNGGRQQKHDGFLHGASEIM